MNIRVERNGEKQVIKIHQLMSSEEFEPSTGYYDLRGKECFSGDVIKVECPYNYKMMEVKVEATKSGKFCFKCKVNVGWGEIKEKTYSLHGKKFEII
jgi:hypothetical protein